MDAKILHELLEYRDGELYWKRRRAGVRFDRPVGSINNHGYKRVEIGGKSYSVHKLIFMMVYGYNPEQIDHIDCNKLNNKIENLREATPSQNSCNRNIRQDNKYNAKNIYFDAKYSKWVVQIKKNGKSFFLGRYSNKYEAMLVAEKARNKYHGSYANHG